uniref:Bidirectional sugar transporter SWEET n=1 Tax=Zea mays TaxID=4577 RepID=B6SU55_MAIZE|nr:seven-transmembrane-domain protein 1 [Zea mays]|eukprot:NP_001147686.1 seven-transmembrane-domain protein 1 [Zea mays]
MEDVVKFAFGVSGNVIALFLFLSPVPTFWRIIRRKSTEDFSGVPYSMTLLNCLLSAWYGLPFVSPNNMLVSTINGAGAAIEAVYVVIFLGVRVQPADAAADAGAWRRRFSAAFAAVALASMLALHGQGRKLMCGLAATVCSICMYASPLSIMRLVVKTKSVEYMPFLLSLAVFLCGTSWFVYGLLGRDPFVAIPNGCGSFLGAVQLVLYAIYRDSNSGGKQQAGDDVEMASDAKSSKKVADDVGGKEDRLV